MVLIFKMHDAKASVVILIFASSDRIKVCVTMTVEQTGDISQSRGAVGKFEVIGWASVRRTAAVVISRASTNGSIAKQV